MGEIKKVEFGQAEIAVNEKKLTVTYIPTATSGCWYTIHDAFEVWGAVAIDMDGSIVGWRNPPKEEWQKPIEDAIIKAFGILE